MPVNQLFVDTILKNAYTAETAAEDYINPDDGLRYCGKCHTPKEAIFENGLSFNGVNKHPTECRCAAEQRQAGEAREKEYRRQSYIATLRMEAFQDIPAAAWSFDRAAVLTPPLQTVRNYADHWEEMQQNNIGLILFGNVGTGKSYAAGCVANAVIARMVSVGFIAVTDIVNRMQGLWGDDRDRFMRSLMRPDLLILDDLGAERNTGYGKECVFDVINRRRLSGKPMIVTTNIPLKYMQQTTDMDERRIFDRILECCMPVQFDCQNFRQVNRQENMKKAIRLLNGD